MDGSAPTLLVGFDSAWTVHNQGSVVAALWQAGGVVQELGLPQPADFNQATLAILAWQACCQPARTLILLDQPTIVPNATGQRPVERIVCSPVSARRGGMQPAFTGRASMFGPGAPVWPFLERFGVGTLGPADALTGVCETYPVLTIIAMGWLIPDPARAGGRLPKYNPGRTGTFARDEWSFVCERTAGSLRAFGCTALAAALAQAAGQERVRKRDQDALDACLCLLAGLHLARDASALAVGQQATGWLVVPGSLHLEAELKLRCRALGWPAEAWVHPLG